MVAGLTRRGAAVVALGAVLAHPFMIESCDCPEICVVTGLAVVSGGHMIRRFACLHDTVVALLALALNLTMLYTIDRPPVKVIVALTTVVAAGNMVCRFSSARNGHAATMAGKTVCQGASESAVDMASLAFHQTVKSL